MRVPRILEGAAGVVTRVGTQDLMALHDGSGWVCAVGRGGTLLLSLDAGARWRRAAEGPWVNGKGLLGLEGGLLVAGDQAFYHSADGGASWEERSSGAERFSRFNSLMALTGTEAELFTVDTTHNSKSDESSAAILRSTDGGRGWTTVWYDGNYGRIEGLAVAGRGQVVATQRSGVLWSLDSGASWHPTGLELQPGAVHGCPDGTAYVLGSRGVLLKGRAGAAWRRVLDRPDLRLTAVWADGAGALAVVGEAGLLVSSADGGSSWIRHPTGLTTRLTAVRRIPGALLAVGPGGVVVRVADCGAGSNLCKSPSGKNRRRQNPRANEVCQ